MRHLILLLFAACCNCLAQSDAKAPEPKTQPAPAIPFDGQVNAPDFPASLEWLNTSRPLSLKDLQGKVVLLDFWTYCCINCMHIIPDLKQLEAKYAKELVVIGVHSAKFENEKLTDNIREAIKRYEIEHPVVNDKDFQVWRSYAVRAWPTLMLINPEGRVIGSHSGEGIFSLFDQVIGETIRYFDAKEKIDRRPIQFELEKDRSPSSVLSYPGKIVADENSKRLFFTDSNHNRIVIATFDGEILECIGEGNAGLKDGSFESAQFFRPQGLCFDPKQEVLYIADTENHAIRKVDLKARTVSTLAGTGQQARRFNVEGKDVPLNSPWDLILIGDDLYIAMAGPHQLWTLDLTSLEARVYAGSGRENITDGPLRDCALAQPSGITTDGKRLFFADSEVSAVRAADLDPNGRVETLIGEGLFEFGDVDGKYPKARLQHPLGVGYLDGSIYVADTYNHKIKKLDPDTKELTNFIGTGKRGAADGPASSAALNEPSGLCLADGKLFIADANNHLIRVCDLKTKEVSTLSWKGIDRLTSKHPMFVQAQHEELATQTLAAGSRNLELRISLPSGMKLSPDALSKLKVRSNDSAVVRPEKEHYPLSTASISIPVSTKAGKTKVTLDLDLYYCQTNNTGLCYFKEASLVVPIEITGESETAVVNYAVK